MYVMKFSFGAVEEKRVMFELRKRKRREICGCESCTRSILLCSVCSGSLKKIAVTNAVCVFSSLGADIDPDIPLFPSPINSFCEATSLFQVHFCGGVSCSAQPQAGIWCESQS